MVTYEIKPHTNVGPIHLGMKKSEVRNMLTEIPDSFNKTPDSDHKVDLFEKSGFQVHYNGQPETVEFIEIFEVKAIDFKLFDLNLFKENASSIIKTMSSKTPVVEIENGCSFLLSNLDISFWRISQSDQKFESVGVGHKGYY